MSCGFDTVVVVDWSGGNDTGSTPRKDAIWVAVSRGERVEPAQYFRNRGVLEHWLTDFLDQEITANRRCLVGFDFPFAYPAGFGTALTGTPDPFAVWTWFESRVTDTPKENNRFDLAGQINRGFGWMGPFWGNGLKRDVEGLPRKGKDRSGNHFSEKRQVEEMAKGAFTCWQLSGAGAVGSQVIMGLPVLSRLRCRFGKSLSVPPFEKAETPIVLAEVWPSLVASAIKARQGDRIKDAVQVEVVAAALSTVSQDALHALLTQGNKEEGWILGVGSDVLHKAAEALPIAGQDPPPLSNDCFALPAGVSWMPVDQALARLRDRLKSVVGTQGPIEVPQSVGRRLSAAVVAARANPPAANTAVDGFGFAAGAIGSGDQRLPLVKGRAAPGAPFAESVPNGSAIRVLTGALLPAGVDTVILEEDSSCDGRHVAFRGGIKPGSNTRKAGEDVRVGETLFEPGHLMRPPDVALLSAVGLPEVAVLRRLRVGVLSTGDELSAPDPDTPVHKTHDANRPMLLSLAERWSYDAVDLGHVLDDAAALRRRLDKAAGICDAILTSGGASAGDEDHVSALLRAEGTLAAWRIALKPGRPLALGQWRGVPVFGLPGNPVAALVCTLIFARPALSVLSGGPWLDAVGFQVPAAFHKNKKPGRREYLRARLTAQGHADVFASEGSGRISGLSWADGLVELPDQDASVAPGDLVRYLPYAMMGL